ncbi:MAG TPA: hypothetical protein VGI77_04765 [Gaiellaceae bacterium]
MTTAITDIDTTPVDRRIAAASELAEARAWADLYAAAPAEWAAVAGLSSRWLGSVLVITWAATGRRYFSRVIGLGIAEPATEEAIDEILAGYEQAGITMFLLQSLPHCEPANYERWLRERGLEPFDVQDRIVRDGRPFVSAPETPERELAVERVVAATADEWAEYLQGVYRLDAGPWLQALVDRPGWHQYVVRDGGEVAGARGMYVGTDGSAWLGMDGPVPGLMTDDFALDAALCAHIVQDGLRRGATSFITDIEVASPAMDTPSYEYFARLGFSLPYSRTHYARL